MARTLAFLGLDPELLGSLDDCERSVGTRQPPAIELKSETRAALCRAYHPDIELLLTEFPEIDGALWPSAGL
jgi:hypothetical protein